MEGKLSFHSILVFTAGSAEKGSKGGAAVWRGIMVHVKCLSLFLRPYPCRLVHLTLAFESGLPRHFCSFMRGARSSGSLGLGLGVARGKVQDWPGNGIIVASSLGSWLLWHGHVPCCLCRCRCRWCILNSSQKTLTLVACRGLNAHRPMDWACNCKQFFRSNGGAVLPILGGS